PKPKPVPDSAVSSPSLSGVSSPSLTGVQSQFSPQTRIKLGALAVVLIGAVWWGVSKANAPLTPPRPVDRTPVAAVTPPVVPVAPVVAAVVDAGEPEVIDAGAPGAVAATPVIAPAPAAPVDAMAKIDVDPNVELTLDGKAVGRTPWAGRLAPGRRVFLLVNKELGIRVYRIVNVSAGEQIDENYKLKQGFVTLSAPEGAQVFINERRIGSAPIRGEIPVYEGANKISVTVGKARWNEAFNLAGGQRINFNVEMQ
ncbi:MAG: serine/threonine protein kinase, partial [Myxococcaceae bacterium]|nr:serine/threonine protein kinase [Myxococcaceae bacterium]